MPRRPKTSLAEDLIDLVARFPWWVGLLVAVLGYVVLSPIASAPLPRVTGTAQLGSAMTSTLWRSFALVGQYLVPAIGVLGALVSFVRRRRRSALLDNTTQSSAADVLQDMSWREFELLVGEGFRRQGYAVKETGGGGADGGVDLVLKKNGETTLVQCKQWKAFRVGVAVVRELYGVMAAHGAAAGVVVTSGHFTKDAVAFASGRNIRLMEGTQLLALLRQAREAREVAPLQAAVPVEELDPMTPAGTPPCPACAQPMVRRVAKRGTSAGSAFWGCSAYPACKGTRPL